MKIVNSNDKSNENEIKILSLFDSPYILKFYDSFTEKNISFKFFIVTEYCQVTFSSK